MILATYFIAGIVFAVGLVFGGMTQPHKIIGFLDVTGDWDPSLAFVMGGAVSVHTLTYWLTMKRKNPLFGERFFVPKRNDIDARLVVGGGLFGIGWALGGFCPGPALVASGALVTDAMVFIVALVVGHWLFGKYNRFAQKRKERHEASSRVDGSPVQST